MTALPYVTSPGNIEKALNAIKSAAVPERVTQDFVKTILKIKGGSGAQMTSFLKKIGFSDSAGTPTDRYRRFRNPSTSGFTVAEAIKEAYAPLFEYNEYVFDLPDNEVVGIIVEVTGHPHDSNPVKLTSQKQTMLNYQTSIAVCQGTARWSSHVRRNPASTHHLQGSGSI